jgi:hypothetical protein
MKSDKNTLSNSMLLTRSEVKGKKIYGKNLPCWKCEMFGHLKRNCSCGAVSEKDFVASACNVSLVFGDDGDLI